MKDLSKRSIQVEIPKPRPLIGGNDPYQKSGLPYWFCTIKNGRDEFMCVYIEDLSIEDLLYDKDTGKKRHFHTICEKDLKIQVEKALKNKPKEGHFWIPVYYPSFNENNELEFVSKERSKVAHDGPNWEKIAKIYSPQNSSELLSAD